MTSTRSLIQIAKKAFEEASRQRYDDWDDSDRPVSSVHNHCLMNRKSKIPLRLNACGEICLAPILRSYPEEGDVVAMWFNQNPLARTREDGIYSDYDPRKKENLTISKSQEFMIDWVINERPFSRCFISKDWKSGPVIMHLYNVNVAYFFLSAVAARSALEFCHKSNAFYYFVHEAHIPVKRAWALSNFVSLMFEGKVPVFYLSHTDGHHLISNCMSPSNIVGMIHGTFSEDLNKGIHQYQGDDFSSMFRNSPVFYEEYTKFLEKINTGMIKNLKYYKGILEDTEGRARIYLPVRKSNRKVFYKEKYSWCHSASLFQCDMASDLWTISPSFYIPPGETERVAGFKELAMSPYLWQNGSTYSSYLRHKYYPTFNNPQGWYNLSFRWEDWLLGYFPLLPSLKVM